MKKIANEERLLLAVDSLRSARAFKKERGGEFWKEQCRIRREYVQDLEDMYHIKYYQLIKTL